MAGVVNAQDLDTGGQSLGPASLVKVRQSHF